MAAVKSVWSDCSHPCNASEVNSLYICSHRLPVVVRRGGGGVEGEICRESPNGASRLPYEKQRLFKDRGFQGKHLRVDALSNQRDETILPL